MDPLTAEAIEAAIKKLVADIAPHARYLPKYGGRVIALDPDSDKKFVGGFYTYADHVSLEFSEGASFDDPDNRLQGKGKKRRHLKFTDANQVTAQDTKSYLLQALK